MLLKVIACPNWREGACGYTPSVSKYGERPGVGGCVACGRGKVTRETIDVATPAVQPVPRDQWPTWAATIATLRQDGEQGVGDTFARIASDSGAAAVWKGVLALARKTCGCAARQARWNREYAY